MGGDRLTEASSVQSSTDTAATTSVSWPQRSIETDEEPAFLTDIDKYIALGCLTSEGFTRVPGDKHDGIWHDITTLPSFFGLDGTLYSDLKILTAAGWIRLWSTRNAADPQFLIYRVYLLPFDVGDKFKFVERRSKKLYSALASLLSSIDVSSELWMGRYLPECARNFDVFATVEEGSLFWLFNKLPSPDPKLHSMQEAYSKEALEDILKPCALPGLSTDLYPYQRRAAGLMLQRETVTTLQLDPRLEKRTAPDGSTFYYSARDLMFLRNPRLYETCKGGILSESMGLGKTLMCLALILATKHHPPKVPVAYSAQPVRSKVASLTIMAISEINRQGIPWKVEFHRLQHATGLTLDTCREKLENQPPFYTIPLEPVRLNRKTIQPPPKRVILAATTIIVVPPNLCTQWQSEIKHHLDEDALNILVMDDARKVLPSLDDLRRFDVILFTRRRFEQEIRDGSDDRGRRVGTTTRDCRCPYIGASRTRDCACIRMDELYDSPLKHLHFKRLIIDEGHFFSNANNTAVTVANKLITADHRWVVSGTPAKDLLGVEVDTSTAENLWHTPETKTSRDAILSKRKGFSARDDTTGAIKSLGSLATHFLRIEPWNSSSPSPSKNEERVEWDEYIFRHEDLHKKTFTGYSSSLRRSLEAMVIKTRPEDVERDVNLPPLSHKIVKLEPSFYDKLTANLFTLVLTANAVTSERTDVDYLFHKNSQKARYHLIANLRQSAFFWTGFSEADVEASSKSSNTYLSKKGGHCSDADRALLNETLTCVDDILSSEGWKSMSRSHELGFFVDRWPSESADHWAFERSPVILLTGVSQLLQAQDYVNERAGLEAPGEGLSGQGIKATASAKEGARKESLHKGNGAILTKSGIPVSSIDGEPLLKKRVSPQKKRSRDESMPVRAKAGKVAKPQKSSVKVTPSQSKNAAGTLEDNKEVAETKKRQLEVDDMSLSNDSPFRSARILGTASAKLSYLLSQILKYYRDEKIICFYDGDNAAYYIAQALELLHIPHEIYAKSLAAHLKAEYVVRFNQHPRDRVLLMDINNAAFGLNISAASRIYFVNPVCRPNVEAQAIKRAHRIGQLRKVHVETLVLKGTIEEKMLERSRKMTRSEHRDASHLEDDGGIRDIIQSARVMHVEAEELKGRGQMAPLDEPQQLWGRDGWREFKAGSARPDAKKRKTVASGTQNIELEATFKSAHNALPSV